jgi:Rrf2 family iron-sulfur cluster assembly transcriptional regulator
VADIILAVNESLDTTQCGGKENCQGANGSGKSSGKRCMTHELWATLSAKMFGYLNSVSLQDLVNQQTMTTAANLHVITLHEQAQLGELR